MTRHKITLAMVAMTKKETKASETEIRKYSTVLNSQAQRESTCGTVKPMRK